jgi:hypothetical protein
MMIRRPWSAGAGFQRFIKPCRLRIRTYFFDQRILTHDGKSPGYVGVTVAVWHIRESISETRIVSRQAHDSFSAGI